MLIPLLNYAGKRRWVALPDNFRQRKAIVSITVIYGDECLNVDYGDGNIEVGRADVALLGDHRGYDGSYTIYSADDDIDLIDDDDWWNRKDSYQFLWGD